MFIVHRMSGVTHRMSPLLLPKTQLQFFTCTPSPRPVWQCVRVRPASSSRNLVSSLDASAGKMPIQHLCDISDEDKKAFFEALDTDKDGRITLNEFKRFLANFLPAAEVPSEQLAREMFRAADKDGNGTITLNEIHAIMEIQ